jgi:alkylation response protein AidB-like acyl-CoA dehydrogenase
VDLSYGSEYESFRAELQKFLDENKDRAPRRLSGIAGAARPRPEAIEWQKLLIERGYAARTIPVEYGGHGAEPDLLKTIIIDEEFSAAGVQGSHSGMGVTYLTPTLLEHGSEEQKHRWIPPALTGEHTWCQGYSEPGAGSDLASLQTSAKEDGDDFLINGQKIWTSLAHMADMMFVLVRTEPDAPKHSGISYILLSMDTPGIEVRPLRTMTGAAEFNQVFFTDVRVPKANVVGVRGEGWKIANTTLKHERNTLGSASQTESYLRSLIALMQNESRNGVVATDSPVLRDRLLRLQARTLTMRYHSMRLLTCTLRGESPGVAGLVMKLQGCQLNHDIAALALDVMGELGALYNNSKYERAKGFWQFQYMFTVGLIIGGGTEQIQKNIISERGLGMPREPKAGAEKH